MYHALFIALVHDGLPVGRSDDRAVTARIEPSMFVLSFSSRVRDGRRVDICSEDALLA